MSRMNLTSSGLCVIATFAVTACASGGQNLEPAKSANDVPGLDRAAEATDNEVQVIAQTAEWPGEARITEKVSPVRVRITNGSDQPVHIRYGHFQLVANDGEVFAAIPPLATRGEVTTNVTPERLTPRFTYTGFSIAPYYVYSYPGITVYDGPFAYDRAYYEMYYPAISRENLPTPEMLAWALPEGVVASGGYVDGYLYFQRVPSDKQLVRFRAVMTSDDTQRNAATAQTQNPSSAAQPQAARKLDRETEVACVSIPFRVD